nr:immunoglobulin alpha-chain [Mus musculus]BAA02025.1 I alpha chain [Mus musculus domesticus]
MRMDLQCGTTWPQEAWLFPYEGHSTALSRWVPVPSGLLCSLVH